MLKALCHGPVAAVGTWPLAFGLSLWLPTAVPDCAWCPLANPHPIHGKGVLSTSLGQQGKEMAMRSYRKCC